MKRHLILAALLLQGGAHAAASDISVAAIGLTLTPPPGWTSAIEARGTTYRIELLPRVQKEYEFQFCQILAVPAPLTVNRTQQEIDQALRDEFKDRSDFAAIILSDRYPDKKWALTTDGSWTNGERQTRWVEMAMDLSKNGVTIYGYGRIYSIYTPGYQWVTMCAVTQPASRNVVTGTFRTQQLKFDRFVQSMRIAAQTPTKAAAVPAPATTPAKAVVPAEPARPLTPNRQSTVRADMGTRLGGLTTPASAGEAAGEVHPYVGNGFAVRAPTPGDRFIMDSSVVQQALARGCQVRKLARQVIASQSAGALNVDEVQFPQGCFATGGAAPLYGVGTIGTPQRSGSTFMVFEYDAGARANLMDYLARQ